MDSIRRHILSNQNLNVHHARQNRHILGSAGYVEGRSILNADPEMLIGLYAGRPEPMIVRGRWNSRERFEHTDIIGTWINEDNTQMVPTNRGVFHYSNNGVHIVPASPERR